MHRFGRCGRGGSTCAPQGLNPPGEGATDTVMSGSLNHVFISTVFSSFLLSSCCETGGYDTEGTNALYKDGHVTHCTCKCRM